MQLIGWWVVHAVAVTTNASSTRARSGEISGGGEGKEVNGDAADSMREFATKIHVVAYSVSSGGCTLPLVLTLL